MSNETYNGYWKATLKDAVGRVSKPSFYGFRENQYWELTRQLRSDGFSIEDLTWKKSSKLKIAVMQNRQRMAVLEAILRLVEVDKSPGSALYHVIDGFEDPAIRTRLEPARNVVRQKGNITDALRITGLMTPPVLAMLEAGESSGSTKGALEDSLKYLQNQYEVFKTTSWKISLIAFELFTTLGLSWGIYVSGKAKISDAVQNMGLDNASALLSKLDVAILINNFLLFTGGGIVSLFVALVVIYASANFALRQTLDPVMLRIPFFRRLLEDNYFGISFGVTARILNSGGQLDKALRTAAESAQVPAVRHYFEKVITDLVQGVPASTAFDSPLLKYDEKVSLTSFSSLKQLGKIFGSMAQAREKSLATNIQKVVFAATAFTVICGGVGFWVLYQGYEILNSGIGQQIHQSSY